MSVEIEVHEPTPDLEEGSAAMEMSVLTMGEVNLASGGIADKPGDDDAVSSDLSPAVGENQETTPPPPASIEETRVTDETPATPDEMQGEVSTIQNENGAGATAIFTFSEGEKARVIKMFKRFDLDQSNNINSREELNQLTLAVFYTFNQEIEPTIITEMCRTVDVATNPMNLESYVEWVQLQLQDAL